MDYHSSFRFLLGRLYYSIVPSSEMSGFVCMFVYMCTLPWPDNSRLRVQINPVCNLYHMIENLSKAKDYANLISSDTIMPHSMNLPLLTFLSLISKIRMDGLHLHDLLHINLVFQFSK